MAGVVTFAITGTRTLPTAMAEANTTVPSQMPTPPPNERMASPAAMHSRASRIDMSMPMRRARNVTSGLTAAKASRGIAVSTPCTPSAQ